MAPKHIFIRWLGVVSVTTLFLIVLFPSDPHKPDPEDWLSGPLIFFKTQERIDWAIGVLLICCLLPVIFGVGLRVTCDNIWLSVLGVFLWLFIGWILGLVWSA